MAIRVIATNLNSTNSTNWMLPEGTSLQEFLEESMTVNSNKVEITVNGSITRDLGTILDDGDEVKLSAKKYTSGYGK